jgi:uncharacterized integral membrane protein
MKKTRLTVVLVLVALVAAVVLQNTESVETRLLFATVTMPRAFLLGVTLLIGFLLGSLTTAGFVLKRQSDRRRDSGRED